MYGTCCVYHYSNKLTKGQGVIINFRSATKQIFLFFGSLHRCQFELLDFVELFTHDQFTSFFCCPSILSFSIDLLRIGFHLLHCFFQVVPFNPLEDRLLIYGNLQLKRFLCVVQYLRIWHNLLPTSDCLTSCYAEMKCNTPSRRERSIYNMYSVIRYLLWPCFQSYMLRGYSIRKQAIC